MNDVTSNQRALCRKGEKMLPNRTPVIAYSDPNRGPFADYSCLDEGGNLIQGKLVRWLANAFLT